MHRKLIILSLVLQTAATILLDSRVLFAQEVAASSSVESSGTWEMPIPDVSLPETSPGTWEMPIPDVSLPETSLDSWEMPIPDVSLPETSPGTWEMPIPDVSLPETSH